MGLTEEQLQRLREAFDSSARPLILFDDDADGLSSFLMVYKHIREGKGIPVKNVKSLGAEMAQKINDYSPDLVVLLDIPVMNQEFFDNVHARTIWLDHHPPQKCRGVEYYNPRTSNPADNRPTSYWVYRVIEQYLWIAMAGMIGDWFMPEEEIRQEFLKKYPELMSAEMKRPEVALHESKIGVLARIFFFNLKGKSAEVIKSVKVLTRIREPDEILKETTAGGRFIYKKYQALQQEYEALMKTVVVDPNDKLLFFLYKSESGSFSAELSNELVYRHPDKVVLVAWEYGGEYKCSMRSTKQNLPQLIEKALDEVDGYGGGHDHAAGACIKTENFSHFVENIRKLL
ncbi:MAG: DHHA1 domain-containing protein [archaeon]